MSKSHNKLLSQYSDLPFSQQDAAFIISSLKSFLSKLFILVAALFLAGCAVSAISPEVREQDLPESWRGVGEYGAVRDGWLAELGDERLDGLVGAAMERNYQLAQLGAEVEAAQQTVIVSGAARLPELVLAFDSSRRRVISNQFGITRTSSNFELGADLSWEIDAWGKLRDVERQAGLNLLAAQARYEAGRRQVAGRVARAWFNVVGAGELLELLRVRLANLEENLDIIESAYNQGLTGALDVYLARTNTDQERARITAQEQTLSENRVALQLLLGDYPDGNLETGATLPLIETPVPAGLPSELISRRPDLQQAWANLLARDAAVAIAHKQRFPRLVLVASGGDVSQDLDSLLDGTPLAWSILGNLTQPLFNAGRLKAQELQARARLVQAENQYLDSLYQAFSEVENAISRGRSLQTRYRVILDADKNAGAGLTLAFEQYQRGLVPYTTVLEAQRRAFDIQSGIIELRNQLLQNRIALYLALGGDFAM